MPETLVPQALYNFRIGQYALCVNGLANSEAIDDLNLLHHVRCRNDQFRVGLWGLSKMNMHTQPALAGDAEPCLIGKPVRAKNKFRVGEIVASRESVAVVLPCTGEKGKQFFKFMESDEVDGEYRSRIFFNLKSDDSSFERLDGQTPTLKLEESGCHLHALLKTTEAGAVIRDCVDLPAFEATLTDWYKALRSIPEGSLDVLRNILDGSAASDRLLNVYENAA